MRTFHDVLADIDREIATADTIPTDAPAPVAAYLRELLARYARTLTTSNGLPFDIVPANAIRSELQHLTRTSHPGRDETDKRPALRCASTADTSIAETVHSRHPPSARAIAARPTRNDP